jgi:hypothetical protein
MKNYKKLMSSIFVNFSKYYYPKIKFYSLLMGKLNKSNKKRFNLTLKRLIQNKIKNKSMNLNIGNLNKSPYLKL